MKEMIAVVFDSLKELDVKSTPHNVSILNGVYEILRGIYHEMEEKENAGTKDRSTSDPDGRNND